jgi:hypothetical protein
VTDGVPLNTLSFRRTIVRLERKRIIESNSSPLAPCPAREQLLSKPNILAERADIVSAKQVSTEERAGSATPREQVQVSGNGAGMTEKVRRQAAALQNSFAFSQVIGC